MKNLYYILKECQSEVKQMTKKTDFKKLVLGNAGKKRVKSGNWSLFGSKKRSTTRMKKKLNEMQAKGAPSFIGSPKVELGNAYAKKKYGRTDFWNSKKYEREQKKAYRKAYKRKYGVMPPKNEW